MIYEITLSTRRLRDLLASKDVRLSDDATIRLVADPAARSLGLEVVSETVRDVATGQYL